MKKIGFLLIVLFTVLISSCSSNNDDDYPNIGNDELAYIHGEFTLNLCDIPYNNKLYTTNVFLFYLDNKHPKSEIFPYSFEYGGETFCSISDVNDEPIFCDYHGKFMQDKDSDGKYVLNGVFSIYKNNYLNTNSNLKKGKYLLVIQTSGTYFCTYLDTNNCGKEVNKTFVLSQESNNGIVSNYTWFK